MGFILFILQNDKMLIGGVGMVLFFFLRGCEIKMKVLSWDGMFVGVGFYK